MILKQFFSHCFGFLFLSTVNHNQSGKVTHKTRGGKIQEKFILSKKCKREKICATTEELCLKRYMFLITVFCCASKRPLYKLVVTDPISWDLFLHVPLAKPLCASSWYQFDTTFPQDALRSPPKHPLLDHKLQHRRPRTGIPSRLLRPQWLAT